MEGFRKIKFAIVRSCCRCFVVSVMSGQNGYSYRSTISLGQDIQTVLSVLISFAAKTKWRTDLIIWWWFIRKHTGTHNQIWHHVHLHSVTHNLWWLAPILVIRYHSIRSMWAVSHIRWPVGISPLQLHGPSNKDWKFPLLFVVGRCSR